MPKAETLNRAKITKAVHALLQRYHRVHGLRVQPWSKQPGSHYFSIYSDAVRDARGEPLHLAELDGSYVLTFYQDHLGVPAWANSGEQLEHPDWRARELRTAELVGWYEEHLSLSRFCRDYQDATRRWRQTYRVEESERYLLTWNVLGLCSSRMAATCHAHECADYWSEGTSRTVLTALPTIRPRESLIYCEHLVFHTDGLALLPDGEVLNLWERFLAGEDARALAQELVSVAGGG